MQLFNAPLPNTGRFARFVDKRAEPPLEEHLPPLYTPADCFFRQQFQPTPLIKPAHWSLMLGGLVSRPIVLSYDDLLASLSVERDVTLTCLNDQSEMLPIANARWTGVPLRDLLAEAGVNRAAAHVHLYAADGYATSIALEWADNALLAHRMNGEPLLPEHGGPVRLIVPGLYGYKMPKWIQRIALAEAPLLGVWEQRGWPQSGIVRTTAAIVRPRHLEQLTNQPVYLAGVAYAGLRAIARVEVSVEDGPWTPVNLLNGTPGVWTRWYALWTPPASGDYRLSVRAVDETEAAQLVAERFASSGIAPAHAIVVRVVN